MIRFRRVPRSSRLRLAGLAGVAVVLLAGCTEQPVVTRADPAGSAPSVSVPAPEQPSGDLAAAKRAAGIADCPVSDPDVATRPDGLPDVVLPCLAGGREVRLAGLRGHPMIINVWAQWCGPCREEAPFLAEVARAPRAGVLVLGVDHADPRPDLAVEFAHLSGWTYPQLADPELVLRSELQVTGPPQTFFVSAEGEVVYRHLGPFSSAAQVRDLAREHLGVEP
jgi:thiol-disulfide isomerase/thioredoxin